MKTLEEIATYYGTAKVPHGYMPIYDNYFTPLRDKKITLLEIGVAYGDSLKMWREYFINGNIIGVDKEKSIKLRGCDIIQGDASLAETAELCFKVNGYFDIVIDDGSHIAKEQVEAFKHLFPLVKEGGFYVVEDLFALYDSDWNNPNEPTIIDLVNGKIKSILTQGSFIQEVHYFGRNDINGILFLRKRYEPYRIQPLSEFEMKKK